MKADNDSEPQSKTACNNCGRPVIKKLAPFCSKHCADADLGRWFKGSYAIPGDPMHIIDGGYEDDED